VPTLLAAASAACALLAVLPAPVHASARPDARLLAPVLSVRRLPGAVSRLVGEARLRTALDAVLADPVFAPIRASSCLVVHDAGHEVYAVRPDTSLVPASNLKLLVGLAALRRLGAGTRYRTEARATAPVVDGALAGDLWLVGAGDPLLATADYAATAGFDNRPRAFTPLERLADGLVAAGVRQVQGRVVGDESRYDSQRYVATWRPAYVANGQVGPLTALSVNDGFAEWRPKHAPAPAPATEAANVLVHLLQLRGVAVTGGSGEGAAPRSARAVASVESVPIGDVVTEMLHESDNSTAELLTKELGARFGGAGTTAAGLGVVHASLSSLKLDVAGLSSVDGSGLDRSDRATCTLLIGLLDRVGPGDPLARALPVAGVDGTLAKRFVGTPAAGRIQAKTGSLEGVVALSGWAHGDQGRVLSFALVANNLPNDRVGAGLADRVAAGLARYPPAPAPDQLAPGAP